MDVSRRNFIKAGIGSLAYFSTASTVPLWVTKSAEALCSRLTGRRVLVIVQMAGGNDGLNTVIPYTDPSYIGTQLVNGKVARPNLRLPEPALNGMTLGDDLNAFHPQLARLKEWWDTGNVAVIQNVGYPNPNFSHFVSTDYWEWGRSPGSANLSTQGWAARFFDNQCAGVPTEDLDPLAMLSASTDRLPLTLRGSTRYGPPVVLRFSKYNLELPGLPDLNAHYSEYIERLQGLPAINSETDFVQRASIAAIASAYDMEVAAAVSAISSYPQDSQLGLGLDIVSKVIRGGFDTSIFYVMQGGYDTHAAQTEDDPATTGMHADLLAEFDGVMHSFLHDMAVSGNLDKVLVMTFSEFGRRVVENGGKGTDHGAANSMFVLGGKGLIGGMYGGQPDLQDLVANGSLRHYVDFRSVYSRIIQDWFEGDPVEIFGEPDFYDSVIDIAGGMAQVPFIDTAAIGVPAVKNYGGAAAAALTALGGAYALRRFLRDDEERNSPT